MSYFRLLNFRILFVPMNISILSNFTFDQYKNETYISWIISVFETLQKVKFPDETALFGDLLTSLKAFLILTSLETFLRIIDFSNIDFLSFHCGDETGATTIRPISSEFGIINGIKHQLWYPFRYRGTKNVIEFSEGIQDNILHSKKED